MIGSLLDLFSELAVTGQTGAVWLVILSAVFLTLLPDWKLNLFSYALMQIGVSLLILPFIGAKLAFIYLLLTWLISLMLNITGQQVERKSRQPSLIDKINQTPSLRDNLIVRVGVTIAVILLLFFFTRSEHVSFVSFSLVALGAITIGLRQGFSRMLGGLLLLCGGLLWLSQGSQSGWVVTGISAVSLITAFLTSIILLQSSKSPISNL